MQSCDKHGLSRHKMLSGGKGRPRKMACVLCIRDRQLRCRNRKKIVLTQEAGGKCAVCGYDRWVAVLSFHHIKRATKEFSIARATRAASLSRCRAEAKKCLLLCLNCHGEFETGYQPTVEKIAIMVAEPEVVEGPDCESGY